MNKKLISSLIAAGVVISGGGYYAYTQINTPLAKIAKAEIEVTEDVAKFSAERFERDIKWFDSNKDKDKSLEVTLEDNGVKIGAFYSPKEKVGIISGEVANPSGETTEPVKAALRDKDNSILLETNMVDYGLEFTESIIKKQFDEVASDPTLKEQIGYLDSSKVKVSELTRILFFDLSTTDGKEDLTASEKKEIFEVIPEESIQDKGNDVYSVTLTQDTLRKIVDKYYSIVIPKAKGDFEKTGLENQQKQVKKSLDEFNGDIEVEYFLNIKDTVVRTFKFKPKNGEAVKINFETITTDNKLVLTVVPEGEDALVISAEKKEKGKYEDKVEIPGGGILVGETKTEGDVTTTIYKEQTSKSSVGQLEIKSDYSGNQLKYTLKADSKVLADVVYQADSKKPEPLVTEFKNLEGKTDAEQKEILNLFAEDFGLAMAGMTRAEYEQMTRGLSATE